MHYSNDQYIVMKRLIIVSVALFAMSRASASSLDDAVSTAHRFGLEMHEFVDGCLIEMKVYHDIKHDDCRAFIRAGDIFNAARDKILKHVYAKGIINKNASSSDQIAAIATIADDKPVYGVLAGWQAMDRFLDRVQLLD